MAQNRRRTLEGDPSGRLQPPVDLGPLLELPAAQAGWLNIPNLSQLEVVTNHVNPLTFENFKVCSTTNMADLDGTQSCTAYRVTHLVSENLLLT